MYLPFAHHGIWGPTEPAKSDESKNARFLDSSLGFASFEVPSSTETLTAKCYLLWSLQPAQLPKVCARFGPTPQNPAVPVSAWRLPRHLVLFVSESTRHRQAPEPDGGCTGRSRLGQKLNPRGGTCFAREIGLDDIGPKPPKNPRPHTPNPSCFMSMSRLAMQGAHTPRLPHSVEGYKATCLKAEGEDPDSPETSCFIFLRRSRNTGIV